MDIEEYATKEKVLVIVDVNARIDIFRQIIRLEPIIDMLHTNRFKMEIMFMKLNCKYTRISHEKCDELMQLSRGPTLINYAVVKLS